MFSSKLVVLITSTTYVTGILLTRNPTPPAPLLLLFCPFLVFPILSMRSLQLSNLPPPRFLSRLFNSHYLCLGQAGVTISYCVSPTVANPHTVHDPTVRLLFTPLSTIFVSVVPFLLSLRLFPLYHLSAFSLFSFLALSACPEPLCRPPPIFL